jgi:hypothetical protein
MKSYIVKLNETGEYFQVEYYITTINKVAFTKNKEKATIFQDGGDETLAPNGVDKVSFNKMRSNEFSFFLHCKGVKSEDITVEYIDAPIQPLLTKRQQQEIREEFKILKEHKMV